MLSIFHFPKVIVFRSIVEIMLIFYVLLIIGNKKYRPDWKNPLLIAVTIFTALYILTSITGVNLYRSFWGTLERMGGVFSFVHYWIFFVILTSVFNNNNANDANRNANDANRNANYANWLKLLKLCVVAGFLSILTAGNAALFAGYLIFILFLALYLLINNAKNANKDANYTNLFYIVVLVLGVPTLFLTAVRGSILSFIGALLLLAFFSLFVSKKRKIKFTALALLVLILALISVFWLCRNQSWVQENPYLRRITDISLETTTVQTRLWGWQAALKGWQERFILGWGPENFNLLFAKHFNPKYYQGFGSEFVWDRAHNVILNTGATMGIIGLLSYLGIFGVILVYFIGLLKRKKYI